MSIQRKIHHLLQSEGADETFRYLPLLRVSLDLEEPVLITEKVDGTTMQAIRGEPWKRFDLFKRGDPRKRLVSEAERYELRFCQPEDPSVKWYLKSFEAHREAFDEFGRQYPDIWIYFEALGANIGARYKGLAPTVRIFDVGADGSFLPFFKTVGLVREFQLPAVAYRWEVFGTLENLLEVLARYISMDPKLPPHELEGWVLRSEVNGNEVVAKIRVRDLQQIR